MSANIESVFAGNEPWVKSKNETRAITLNNSLTVNGISSSGYTIRDNPPTTDNGAQVYGSLYMANNDEIGSLSLVIYDSPDPLMSFWSSNTVAPYTATNPEGWTPLLQLRPFQLPKFTYGPVCYGFIPAGWDQSKALVLPYFITGGFQIANTSTGVYTITYPNNLTNVTCQVSLGTVEGGYMMGCCVQLQTVPNQLTINTFQIKDANNTSTIPESLPFNLTINAGVLTF